MSEIKMTRRGFLTGAALAGAAMAGAGFVGCSPSTPDAAADNDVQEPSINASETVSVDVVVVGAGISGLSAAVQAGELGLNTVVLEKMSSVGGNGNVTSGVYGIDTKMQAEAGVHFTFRDVIAAEQDLGNYRGNALFWREMSDASSDNIDWLADNGVLFEGLVDYYYGFGDVASMHWWKGDDGRSYTAPMQAKAESYGVVFHMETAGKELILEDGKVVGIYAERADGSFIRFDSKAVIIASGGYGGSPEMMAERGYAAEDYYDGGLPGHDGDGLRMAIAAGAADVSMQKTHVGGSIVRGESVLAMPPVLVNGGPDALWVNENAERYTNEACGKKVEGLAGNAVHSQAKSFVIADSDLVAKTGSQEGLDDLLSRDPGGERVVADTLEELASLLSLDADALKATIGRYNELCESGSDDDFGKAAEHLNPVKTAPFYGIRMVFYTISSVGGIHTDRSMRALTMADEVIEGLYAVGTDGCELYMDTYSLTVPGSANGHNVHSGRVAARHIADNLV